MRNEGVGSLPTRANGQSSHPEPSFKVTFIWSMREKAGGRQALLRRVKERRRARYRNLPKAHPAPHFISQPLLLLRIHLACPLPCLPVSSRYRSLRHHFPPRNVHSNHEAKGSRRAVTSATQPSVVAQKSEDASPPISKLIKAQQCRAHPSVCAPTFHHAPALHSALCRLEVPAAYSTISAHPQRDPSTQRQRIAKS